MTGESAVHQHQRALDVFVDLLQIWLRAFDQESAEVYTPSFMIVTEWATLKMMSGL